MGEETQSVLVHVKTTRRGGGNWSLFLLCDLHNHKMAIGSSGVEEPFESQVAEHRVPSALSRHGRLEAGRGFIPTERQRNVVTRDQG